MAMTSLETRPALRWAQVYRQMGFNVLPSREDEKRPMVRFAHLWEEMAPAEWFTESGWLDTRSIQIMCGRRWRLAVLDLDGPDAIAALSTLGPPLPRTWVSTSGGGGQHWWFRVDDGPPMPKRLLWGVWDATAREGKGAWEKRKAIEFLGDRSLVMAPPSIHPRTGRTYRFKHGHSPREMARPAYLPAWVSALPTPECASAPRAAAMPAPVPRKSSVSPLPKGMSRDDVLAAIPDKAAVARSWGVRVLDQRPGPNGWVDCHDFDREDRHPSARFHPAWGLFWRPGERPMSLFDLGVARGVYATWLDCCADLASIYLYTPKDGRR